MNGDGLDDLIISADYADPGGPYSGAAYVVFGGLGSLSALDALDGISDGDLDLSLLNGATGFRLDGAAIDDLAGRSVSAAGDVNGDGFDDLLVGGTLVDRSATLFDAGAAYVVYGADFRGEVTHAGTPVFDLINGTAAADIIIGAEGDDTIFGNGGADAINAGAGNDVIHVTENGFFRVDGGGNTDTLHFDYAGAIDFGNIDGIVGTSDRGKIAEIEILDVANGLANDLTLHLADVLDINCDNRDVGGIASLDNVLRIDGGTSEGDTLTLFTADGWVDPPDIATLGGYAIYSSGNVRIAVDEEIAVSVT